MAFQAKYISQTEKKEKPEDKRVVLSDDAFAISEMIDSLINALEHARSSLIR